MMHDSEEGMSWKCKTHLEFNDIQPVRIGFLAFYDTGAFPPVELLSGHKREDWEAPGGNV